MIKLTKKQGEAVRIMASKFHSNAPITVIAGYAGTGKTSIINYFIENNNLMDKTSFATFTGKASLVLQNQGLPATTIHRLIYNAFKNRSTGKFHFRKKETLDPNLKLIVVDEISMVPEKLLRDLMSYQIPIIALGDPGQLEPIGRDNGLLKNPDYFLDEIHRQEEGNSIIQLSMGVREGKPLPLVYDDPNIKIIKRDEVSLPMLQWADQILCGRNNTRRAINQDVRNSYGFSGLYPNVGEKVICLRNYWDTVNLEEEPLINGTIGTVKSAQTPKIDDIDNILQEDVILDIEADYTAAPWENVQIDSNIFKGHAPFSKQEPSSRRIFHEFDFGYAVTVHKFQGSQADNVLVFEERLGGGEHARWLYTAITRAAKKLIIVKQ